MGSLILCHKKKAVQPYEITSIHRRIYTLEELCYYICNNIYLIDYTVMNDQLCDWISEELELKELAGVLKNAMKRHGSVEQFVLTILRGSGFYTQGELLRVQNILEKLKNQKEIERKKFKGDNLLASGEVRGAILVYLSILYDEKDDTVERKFYGRVYGSLGAAYGRLFLYQEAADMYEKAFEICEEESMLKAYLYSCRRYMDAESYRRMIGKCTAYIRLNEEITEDMEEAEEKAGVRPTMELLDKWKKKYRKNC